MGLGEALDETIGFRKGRVTLKEETRPAGWTLQIERIQCPADPEILFDVTDRGAQPIGGCEKQFETITRRGGNERRPFRPRGRELARNITGCAVKAGARGMDIGITTVGPIDEVRHRLQQGLA